MNKILAYCIAFLLSAQFAGAGIRDEARLLDTWSEMNSWPVDTQPIDLAQTLDKKLVFVLGDNGSTYIYSAVGEQIGMVRTGGRPVALAIEPRGRMLYLADQTGQCTAVNISLEGGVLNWSVRKTWKTAARPLDIAVASRRNLVFVLENDRAVHVYTLTGQSQGTIPVDPGTSALNIVPRSRTLYLMSQDGFFSRLESPY